MSRNKFLLAVLVLTAMVGLGSQLQAQTLQAMFAGSSAQWQTLALGTFGGNITATEGNCGSSITVATPPCYHWTDGNSSGTNAFALYDNRPSTPNVDAGAIWIVWDTSATCAGGTCNVWAFIKVDSGVGNRCYFASPACDVYIAAANLPATGSNNISTVLWGDDTNLPANVAALFTTASSGASATPVTVSATDIRPEDSLWSTCRTNSNAGMNAFDTTDGLGYNTLGNYKPGVCATYPKNGTGTNNNAVGDPVLSGYPGSSSQANVLAWALTGKDPITNGTVPKYTVYSVGAAPVVFVYSDTATNGPNGGSPLAGLINVNDSELQQLFSGALCDAGVFGASDFASGNASTGGIAAYLREPLSGTMNTTEANVFRYPVGGTLGISQELGVSSGTGFPTSPLTRANLACPDVANDGQGGRWRGIGTGEVVKSVQHSVSNNGVDGMAYAFFSYGNVGSLSNSANYGYAQLDGVDGIFASYCSGAYGSAGCPSNDPGQPANGEVPGVGNLPATCAGAFPCPEWEIWTGGLSFPNLRSGNYRAWSLLRIVSYGTRLTQAEGVVKSSQKYVVTTTPDFIPATKQTITVGKVKHTDPGLKVARSHYQQVDGSGKTKIGGAGVTTLAGTGGGGDMGGCVEPTSPYTSQLIVQLAGIQQPNCATRATLP